MSIIVLQPTLFSGKVCQFCEQWKPFSDYGTNREQTDGRARRCKHCSRLRSSSDPSDIEFLRRKDLEYSRAISTRRNVRDKSRSKRRQELIKNGGTYTLQEWRDLCAHYDYRCLRCGKRAKLSLDHVLPVSKGGSNTIDNIQPLCWPCNNWKHDKFIDYRSLHQTPTDDL